MFAHDVVDAVFQTGLRIPEDVAVIAFGTDTPLRIDDVGLSIVAIDMEAIAEALVERFTLRMENPLRPPVVVSLPVRLVIRGSCGEPPLEWHSDVPSEAASDNSFASVRSRSAVAHVRSTPA
jgi:LacI family transcriptional regulator